MAKVWVVNFGMNQGPYPPSISTSFHTAREAADATYQDCLEAVGDDPCTVEMIEFDPVTGDQFRREYFEGTYEDLEEEA